MDIQDFIVDKPVFDPGSRIARFGYRLGALSFTELLELPEGFDPGRATLPAFLALLDLTALVLGVSYYKLKAPLNIVAPEIGLSAEGHGFILDVYENGLAEFFTRNDLKRFGRITLKADGVVQSGGTYAGGHGVLLPIGGGKDSLVSAALLEENGLDFTPFAVNPKGPIVSSVDKIGREGLFVGRALDKEMIRLGGQEGFYNGHVPSTAINSMIAAQVAVLFGFERIILSNERSADEGNVEHDGRVANHQYSKSLGFEARIAEVLTEATGGTLSYFSLLRPLSELHIARIFARSERFDHVFSSCNVNFKLSGSPQNLWCGNCPKCHFVFLMLATAMPPERLVEIFGQDLLDISAHESAYRELSGLAGQKPWECVGEILEAASALWHLGSDPDWQNRHQVSGLRAELEGQYGAAALEAAYAAFLMPSVVHRLPADISTRVDFHAV